VPDRLRRPRHLFQEAEAAKGGRLGEGVAGHRHADETLLAALIEVGVVVDDPRQLQADEARQLRVVGEIFATEDVDVRHDAGCELERLIAASHESALTHHGEDVKILIGILSAGWDLHDRSPLETGLNDTI
ncbi:MAG: hypothetical protein UX71_C0005G0090, partial [Parcubacteria group bacterium GW2011_GWA1_47_10]